MKANLSHISFWKPFPAASQARANQNESISLCDIISRCGIVSQCESIFSVRSSVCVNLSFSMTASVGVRASQCESISVKASVSMRASVGMRTLLCAHIIGVRAESCSIAKQVGFFLQSTTSLPGSILHFPVCKAHTITTLSPVAVTRYQAHKHRSILQTMKERCLH
jgi:hypothetical protein